MNFVSSARQMRSRPTATSRTDSKPNCQEAPSGPIDGVTFVRDHPVAVLNWPCGDRPEGITIKMINNEVVIIFQRFIRLLRARIDKSTSSSSRSDSPNRPMSCIVSRRMLRFMVWRNPPNWIPCRIRHALALPAHVAILWIFPPTRRSVASWCDYTCFSIQCVSSIRQSSSKKFKRSPVLSSISLFLEWAWSRFSIFRNTRTSGISLNMELGSVGEASSTTRISKSGQDWQRSEAMHCFTRDSLFHVGMITLTLLGWRISRMSRQTKFEIPTSLG